MAMKLTLQVQEVRLVSSVIIQHFNGKKFDLDELGYRVQMISPFGSNWTQAVTQLNRYVNIVQQPKVQPKTFTLTLAMNCQDITGLQLKYEALSMIFNGEYYILRIFLIFVGKLLYQANRNIHHKEQQDMAQLQLLCIVLKVLRKLRIQLQKFPLIKVLIATIWDYLVLVLIFLIVELIQFIHRPHLT